MPNRLSRLDVDLAVANGQLEVMRLRQDDLTKAIEELEKTRNGVIGEVMDLEARIKMLEAEKVPINRLPNEILLEILVNFVLDDAAADWRDGRGYHIAPVAVSHVCSRWRQLCLAESKLWSRLSLCTASLCTRPLKAFLQRSGRAPLDVIFAPPDWARRGLGPTVEKLMKSLLRHSERCRSFKIYCPHSTDLEPFFAALMQRFPALESIDAAITTLGPEHLRLIEGQTQTLEPDLMGWESQLKYLRLEEIPLFTKSYTCNVPEHLLKTITSLELCFPPTLSTEFPNSWRYALCMDHLRQFLLMTPQLENLSLITTTILFDIRPITETNLFDENLRRVPPVPLEHLKRLEWYNYPSTKDLRRLMSLLDCPNLETMELCLDAPQIADAERSNDTWKLEYPLLRELSLQSADPQIVGSAFRGFSFPNLERLGIGFASSQAYKPTTVLPRPDDIFRDPRLPALTHLTLVHLALAEAPLRALLGYAPNLRSIHLSGCIQTDAVLSLLQERAVSTYIGVHGNDDAGTPPQVKFCPRVVSLSLLECKDVHFESIQATVAVRSQRHHGLKTEQNLEPGAGNAGRISVTGDNAKEKGEGDGRQGRKIKPLRKSRLQGASSSVMVDTSIGPAAGPVDIRAARLPRAITRVAIEGCPLVTQEDALALRRLGVLEVVWKGGETETEFAAA
ncbi:hypothetical protein HGRIS_014486 [Hohenbuehelia grisea]|uniref:F-box domain-containing protein n=1 Tax=Hohenbuehelia grisea TaxID=104357 RepID=A0ABR3JTR9_9AGAR